MLVVKRDGQHVEFDKTKIELALKKANASVSTEDRLADSSIEEIAITLEYRCSKLGHMPSVEEIQDMVVVEIMKAGKFILANNYIVYRYQRQLDRQGNTTDAKVLAIVNGTDEDSRTENSNKDIKVASVQRDYIAGTVSRDMTQRFWLPKDVREAHEKGLIHFHDSDFFAQKIHNCCLVNLDDMLQNGTVISGIQIERPKSFYTACNIATQIVAQVASMQYGGQTLSLTHIAKFVDVSRKKIRRKVESELLDLGILVGKDYIERIVEKRLADEISSGVQTIQYQLVTLQTTNGQTPFVSLCAYLNEAGEDKQLRKDLALVIEEVLKQRYQGVKNSDGIYITPAFPKILYFLEEDNIYEDSEYYYLTKLAAKCSAKRLTPDYISERVMLKLKGDAYPCMGCRSFLTVDETTEKYGNIANAGNYVEGQHKYYGRFNAGVVTLNLPFVAMQSKGNLSEFWKLLDESCELCHKALQVRHKRLRGTSTMVAPMMFQFGALARLSPDDTIDELLYHGYSTLSLGYAGLFETVKFLTGYSHTDPSGKPLALDIMKFMNNKCAQWREAEDIHYSLYGTPIESVTQKFALALQKEFGIVKDVSDHQYITNSYHVNVREEITAFDKLKFESEFQALSPGGAISYVEIPNLQDNLEAVLNIIKFIYFNIIYAELNTKSDYCFECGWEGEIDIVDDGDKLGWRCPKCGNRNQDKMFVARRTCGYIGTQWWNQGRTQEIRDRVLHVGIGN